MGVLINMVPAVVKDRSGAILTTTAARVWREVPGRPTPAGQAYDHKAIVGAEAAAHLVGKQNRTLTVDGIVYNVVNATPYDTLGYVEVDLRINAANG